MADKSTEKTQQAAREATGTADETAQGASEAAAGSYEQFLTLGRDNMEGMARASHAMLKGTSELGSRPHSQEWPGICDAQPAR